MRPALEDERDLEPWDDDPDGVDAHYIRESSEPEIDDEGREIWLYVYLKFRRYAAVASLVGAGSPNRADVPWAGVVSVIWARRNAVIMSSMETWRLWRYHGAVRRRVLRSAAGWPAWSYHRTRMVRFARPRGVVRSTAVGSQVWASPAPRSCFPSLIDCSMV